MAGGRVIREWDVLVETVEVPLSKTSVLISSRSTSWADCPVEGYSTTQWECFFLYNNPSHSFSVFVSISQGLGGELQSDLPIILWLTFSLMLLWELMDEGILWKVRRQWTKRWGDYMSQGCAVPDVKAWYRGNRSRSKCYSHYSGLNMLPLPKHLTC